MKWNSPYSGLGVKVGNKPYERNGELELQLTYEHPETDTSWKWLIKMDSQLTLKQNNLGIYRYCIYTHINTRVVHKRLEGVVLPITRVTLTVHLVATSCAVFAY